MAMGLSSRQLKKGTTNLSMSLFHARIDLNISRFVRLELKT